MNPLWDALVEGIGVTPATTAERSLYGKTTKELAAMKVQPEEVVRRCANFREHWPDTDLTVHSLMRHWSRMDKPAPPPSIGRGGKPKVDPHALAEATMARIRQREQGEDPHPLPDNIIEAQFSQRRA